MAGALEGRTAIVTGAARGTGAAIAERFVEAGAHVLLADLRADGVEVAERLGPQTRFRQCDITDEAQWSALVQLAMEWTGRVDVLVNNAAVLTLAAIHDTTAERFRQVLDVNTTGAFLGMKAVLEPMTAGGGGSIVNVASTAGLSPTTGTTAYAASKFALRGLTRAAALELGRLGIRVNAICPGVGSAEMMLEAMPADVDIAALQARGEATAVLDRWGTTADVASAALFLASNESRFITGVDLVVDGGMTVGVTIEGLPGTERWPTTTPAG